MSKSLSFLLALVLLLGGCRRYQPLPPPVPTPGPVVPDPTPGPQPVPEPPPVVDGPKDQVNAFSALRGFLERHRAGQTIQVGELQQAEAAGGFKPYKTLTRDAAGNLGVTRYVYAVWYVSGNTRESRDAEVVTVSGAIQSIEVGV